MKWVLKIKGQNVPMSKWRSTCRDSDPRMVCAFNWDHAKMFKSKEEALNYLDFYYPKYKDQIKNWYPMRADTLLKRMRENPIYILRTRRLLMINAPRIKSLCVW